jgi:membrane protease YdiL (CAAX protease family)
VSIWPAVALTTLAFGAIHILNVFMTGELRAALIQSAAAALSGLLFIALRLRTGSLWPPIIVHGLWDFATFAVSASRSVDSQASSSGGPMTLMTFMPILLVLPNALYGLWLMRHIGETHAQADR